MGIVMAMNIKIKNDNGRTVTLRVRQLKGGEIEIVRYTSRKKNDFNFLLVPDGTAYMMLTFDSTIEDPNEGQYGKELDAVQLGEALDYATNFQPQQ